MSGAVRRVAIIGGGITGLSAAFRIHQEIHRSGVPLDWVMLESQDRLGGKIRTVRHGDFLIETGPDSFHPGGGSLLELADAVGMGPHLVHGAAKQAYIYARGALRPIPDGMVMGVPTKLMPFLRSGLLSPGGKLAVAFEALRWRGACADDESVGSFFRRRFGGELVDQLIDPLFAAIYGETVERLSMQAVMPRMTALLRQHRSLILGLRRVRAQRARSEQAASGAEKPAAFASFRGGLQSLVGAVEAQLPPAAIIRDAAVTDIRPVGGRYRLTLRGREALDADAVILAVPSQTAAELLDMSTDFESLHESPPASVANVVLGFRSQAIRTHTPGTGFVVARQSGCAITACTWSHLKWPGSAPQGHALLRSYVGRPDDDSLVSADERAIVQTVLRDLKRIMGIDAQPEFQLVTRWHKAMPRYAVGHVARVAALRRRVAGKFPGVQLAGAPYGGVGLADCARQGGEAAQAALARLLEI
ncbi:protoporphyrinogen oxidase [Castellaniella sp. MT123]|uniref:protoporphyrinogen oxidase n=1 Tax=Castellaniella sp. MT123 TaxID=3140381 RepID=UPI0031F443B8